MNNTGVKGARLRTIDITMIGLFCALGAVCAWISFPIAEIPITMQTFSVFLTLAVLGGMRGTISIALYVALGAVGVPVFSGMRGGIGVLLGVTGGYIIGFIFSSLVFWLITARLGNGIVVTALASVIGLIICYAFGSLWFMAVYASGTGSIGLGAVLIKCVIPYLIPDAVKIALAVSVSGTLRKIMKNRAA